MIRIYGASDDLIEIEGDIEEEFSTACPGHVHYLGLSNGVVLGIRLDDDGLWRLWPLHGQASIWQCTVTNLDGAYSDVATIDENVTWVMFGEDCVFDNAR